MEGAEPFSKNLEAVWGFAILEYNTSEQDVNFPASIPTTTVYILGIRPEGDYL